MSQTVPNIQLLRTDIELPYLKKRKMTPKIPRHKLQNEFAYKGWNTCPTQFEQESSIIEGDIISSPTKYPASPRKLSVNVNHPKKKPMLVEISNIESVFKQNKFKPSKLEINGKLPQGFYDFVPNLKEIRKFTQISHLKRVNSKSLNFQNIQASFQDKKQCNESLKSSDEPSTVLISDCSPLKVSTYRKEICLNNVRKYKNLSDSFASNSLLEKECANKKSHSDVLIKDQCSYLSVKSTNVPNVSVSVPSKKCENETLRTVLNKSLNKNHCDESLRYHQHFSIVSDCSSIEREVCLDQFKSSHKAVISNFSKDKFINKIPDSPISIKDESSPESVTSPKVLNTSLLPFKKDETDHLNAVLKSSHKRRCSESFNLQDLKESFEAKKIHAESLMATDPTVELISDCSPVKVNGFKKEVCASTTNKFKSLSEVFANNSSEEKCVDKNSDSDILIQNDGSPNVKSTKIVSSASLNVSSFEDDIACDVRAEEVSSERKSMVFNKKTFLQTVQSSFHEKSSSTDKGSNWVQSLNWDQPSETKDSESEYVEPVEKKTFKNIVPGGFVEQMLKLQRKERSDRVIWNHKMDELKKRAEVSSVTFTLTSVLQTGHIIMTKCCMSDIDNEDLTRILCKEKSEDFHSNYQIATHDGISSFCDTGLPNTETKHFIILFKKDIFSKLHLKIGDSFTLYPPWQILRVPSLLYPVILCTYFVDHVPKTTETTQKESSVIQCFPVMYKSVQIKACKCEEPEFCNTYLLNSTDLYGKHICVSARIQRIWRTGILDYKIQALWKANEHFSFSVLLQTQDDIFLELKLNSSTSSGAYHEFFSDAEGRCFRFCDVVISHRYNLKKCYKLNSVIDYIRNNVVGDKVLSTPQMFCYQCIPSSFRKVPHDISEENFPLYCVYDVKPLSFLQKNNLNGLRFSCIGKVLFQNEEDIFISDESLLSSKLRKYYKLMFAFPFRKLNQSIVGAVIFIKEAIICEKYLFVDQFSSCEVLSKDKDCKFMVSFESRLKKIGLITTEHVLSPLSLSSKVEEFFLVKGMISQVDEKSAMSWLECSFCLKDNLLEDSNSVIYCEDCSCVVPKPVLKVKMEVTVHATDLFPAKVKIQLLSTTIKRILKINEDNYQPECNISDVLKKSTGVLCCYIRSIETTVDKMKLFYLTEVNSS